jgi:hypothetical protein
LRAIRLRLSVFSFGLAPTAPFSGMLDLLRDAFNYNWTVCLDHLLVPGKNNGVIIRVELTK